MEGVCCNCHRVLWVEGGEEVLDELGRRFCGQNCLWSVLLDGGHRRARLQQHALVRTLTMPDDALVQNLNQQPALPNAHENTARRNHPRSHHPHNPSVDPAHGHLRRFRHDMNHDMEPCDDLLDDPCRHALSRNHSLQPLEKKKANAYESALGGLPVRGRMDIPLSPIHEDGFGDDSQNAMFAFHRINYPVNSVRGR